MKVYSHGKHNKKPDMVSELILLTQFEKQYLS